MAANIHLEHVAAYGYKTATAATAITQTIPGRPGERLAVRAYSFGCGATATNAYFMQVVGSGTIAAAVASGGSTLTMDAEIGSSSNALAANDWIAVVQDDGTYHFSIVGVVTTSVAITLCTVVTDTIADGNAIYDLGVYSDTGHYLIKLTATSGSSAELDGGIMYAAANGYPMICYHANDAAGAGSIRYLTLDYLNL